MAHVTVSQFADVLKVPVDRLLTQLEQAGITVAGADDLISDEAKLELLTHLRRSHAQAAVLDGASRKSIAAKRGTRHTYEPGAVVATRVMLRTWRGRCDRRGFGRSRGRRHQRALRDRLGPSDRGGLTGFACVL